jgi:hypothetical protein
MAEGWIKLHRQLMDNAMYFSEPFTRCQAWIDLLLLANNKDSFFFKRGIRVDVKRGQVGYDIESLGKRWKWSRGKVERFISMLENDSQVVRQKNNITTLISICKYNIYQSSDKANDNPNSKADGQQTIKQTDTNKKEDNYKNEKNDKKEDINYTVLCETFITLLPELPKVTIPLSEKRIKAVNAMAKEYGKEKIIEMLRTVQRSPHLLGENDRGWKANFDWLFNPTNFLKVIEGNYLKSKNESNTGFKRNDASERRSSVERLRELSIAILQSPAPEKD